MIRKNLKKYFVFSTTFFFLTGCQSWERRHVPDGINDRFRDPDVPKLQAIFESEDREIFVNRNEILDLVEIRPGMDVADIGAGTGFMIELMSERVGETGTATAVEIGEAFLEQIEKRAKELGRSNIRTVLCKDDSVELPPDSIDLAFICDTYHHFEHPYETMRSLYRALRPGGRVVLIDFERIPGVSRQWVINHVRAGRNTFRDEVCKVGFEFIQKVHAPFLEENYVLLFRKPSA